jgi:hypothetical protein
MKNIGLMI